MLENFFNETANLGTTNKLSKAKKATYQGQTVTDMRNDLVERAQATIKALEAHKGGPLRAPMARSIRNGIEVKIGYGKRNVGFFKEKADNEEHKAEGKKTKPVAVIPARNFARSEAFVAAAYLRKAINLVKSGEFDELLNKALADMTARFTVAPALNEEKPSAPALDEEKPSNVLALQAA